MIKSLLIHFDPSSSTQATKGGGGNTCENDINFLHDQLSIFCSEAHWGLELEHVAMRSVSTEKNVLFL